jgi:Na+-transporting methylmalonyl-CoA/oxaloacetate decarboxylase beta subunit
MADKFLQPETLGILVLGMVAFAITWRPSIRRMS